MTTYSEIWMEWEHAMCPSLLNPVIADLRGELLGIAFECGNTIHIDRDAGGLDWGRVDLFSAVTHEIGHLLGFDHDVMGDSLDPDLRFLPNPSASRLSQHGNDDHLSTVDHLFGLTGGLENQLTRTPGRILSDLPSLFDSRIGTRTSDSGDSGNEESLGYKVQLLSKNRILPAIGEESEDQNRVRSRSSDDKRLDGALLDVLSELDASDLDN